MVKTWFVLLIAVCHILVACDVSNPSVSGTGTGDTSTDAATLSDNPPKRLAVTLKPSASGNALDRLDVQMVMEAPDLAAGEQILRMPIVIVSTPTAAYTADDITVIDDRGKVRLTTVDEEPTPTGVYRHWLVDRATEGDVTVRYGTPPRPVDSSTRNGPLFDIRQQAGGLIGAGVYFYALPVDKRPFDITLTWDMTASPAGTRGVWSLGEGDRQLALPAEVLAFSYYAMGPVQSYPGTPEAEEEFGMYWLAELPWDSEELAGNIQTLYGHMAAFFEDTDSSYKVFVRENPYPSGGGSGLASSFMFSFGSDVEPGEESPQSLIAHEMAHNWPKFNADEPHAETAWYTEGTAEFYSALLSYRGGLMDLDDFVISINEKARDYYTNPFIHATNAEAGEMFWQDDRAQRVPYGRGFMYLVQLDGQLRANSGGERSLDDLVNEVLRRQGQEEQIGTQTWVKLVISELGPDAGKGYEAMTSGEMIVPTSETFGDCLEVVETRDQVFELGFDRMSLDTVKDLRPGSTAERAGLREGDAIRSLTPLKELRDNADLPMEMQVQRGDQILDIEYSPRGDDVPAWQWKKNPAADAEACAL